MEMRQYRMGLIQTADQLRFSYLAIVEGARQVLGISSDDLGIGGQKVGFEDSLIISKHYFSQVLRTVSELGNFGIEVADKIK